MNVSIEEVSSIKRKLTVELPEEEAQKIRKKHLDDYVRKARLKGFRPGKAPRSMVAKLYAEELRREVLEELVSAKVPVALEEHKLQPIGMPMLETVEDNDGQPFKFSVTVELRPEFQTPEWKGLKLEKLPADITDEMVGKKLEELRSSLSTVRTIEEDRPLAMNDLANINYVAIEKTAEGEKLVNGVGGGPFNVELGRDGLIEGFSEGLVGAKAGETRDIDVTMPEDVDNKKLAGKKITLRTTVNDLRVRELPELDDEMAKDLSLDNVETLDDLKNRIRDDLRKEKEDQADSQFNRQLTQILAGLVDIEVPSAMVDREVSNKIESMRQNFARNGLDFRKMGVDMGMLRSRFRPQAIKSVTAALVLDQIGRDNNISVTDEDLEREFEEMSRDYGQSVETIRDYYKSQNLMDTVREGLKVGKTLDLVKASAEIVEVDHIDPVKLGYESAAEQAQEQAEGEHRPNDGTVSEAEIINQLGEELATEEQGQNEEQQPE